MHHVALHPTAAATPAALAGLVVFLSHRRPPPFFCPQTTTRNHCNPFSTAQEHAMELHLPPPQADTHRRTDTSMMSNGLRDWWNLKFRQYSDTIYGNT